MFRQYLKHLWTITLLIGCLPPHLTAREASGYVTYGFSGGRFGDQLVSYLHAKWIAYKYNATLLYQPFDFSDKLCLSELETCFDSVSTIDRYFNIIKLQAGSEEDIQLQFKRHLKKNRCILMIPYFPLSKNEFMIYGKREKWPNFEPDWNDPEFKKILQKNISPKEPLTLPDLPKDKITVCIHIRIGKEYDGNNMEQYYPLKFPPVDYYLSALKSLYLFLGQIKLYVRIFSDDSTTEKLVTYFRDNCDGLSMEFDTRLVGNFHTKNVLEDFFLMQRFDCIIHGESNFSYVASIIGNYAVKIRPEKYHFENRKLYIDASAVSVNKSLLKKRIKEISLHS